MAMNRIFAIFLAMVMAVSLFFSCFGVAQADEIDQAKRLVKKSKIAYEMKMYDDSSRLLQEADDLLRKKILSDLRNACNHYRVALVYLSMGWESKAEARFQTIRDVLKDKKYCEKIALYYKAKLMLLVGDEFGKREFERAKKLYAEILSYNPNLRKPIAEELFVVGKDYLKRGIESRARRILLLTGGFYAPLRPEISDLYFNVGKHIKGGRAKIDILLMGAMFHSKNDKAIAKEIGKEVKRMYKKGELSIKEIDRYRQKAKYAFQDKLTDTAFPVDYDIYHRGDVKIFIVNVNECTRWIRAADDVSTIRFASAKKNGWHSKYEKEYRDGTKISMDKTTYKSLYEDFRLCGVNKSKVRLKFE